MTEKNNTIALEPKKAMKKTNSIKKGIGKRFKQFRDAIGKTQAQMAEELNVYQSTITNIEIGKTFPNIKYLVYFLEIYRFNPAWLFSNKGDMFLKEEAQVPENSSILFCPFPRQDYRYKYYVEMIDLMELPEIEQIVLAKIVELKVFAKEEIKEFKKKKKAKEREI